MQTKRLRPRLAKRALISAALLSALATMAGAQTVQFPGYSISVYRTQLPGGDIAAMAINPVNRNIYYTIDFGASPVYRVPGTGGPVGISAGSAPAGYPYEATDIEYYSGSVYMAHSVLNRFNVQTMAAPTTAATLPSNFGVECGLARVGDTLYISGGSTTPGHLAAYSLSTGVLSATSYAVPNNASSMEYDPVRNRLYIATDYMGGSNFVGYYWIDMIDGGLHTLIPATVDGPGGIGNFTVDPSGNYLYTKWGTSMLRISTDTGEVVPFITGLDFVYSYSDCVFGPSTSGSGWSMYLGDMGTIREVRGFVPGPGTGSAFLLGSVAALSRRRRSLSLAELLTSRQ